MPPQRMSLTGTLKRVRLAVLPTRIDEAPRLSARLGGPRLLIKREDQSGLAFGGNKPRQLEFVMAEALAAGASAVLTTAAVQSNFCRAMSAACACLGLKPALLLRGTGAEPLQGNYLLDRLFGAEIRFIDTTDPYDPRVAPALEAFVADLRARGEVPHVVHLPGRTGALAAASAVSLAEELDSQWRATGLEPAAIGLAVGSGLTLAGLALGLKRLGRATRVVGFSVQKPADFMVPLIARRASEAAALLGLSTRVHEGDFDIDDTPIGPGYGVPTPAAIEAVFLAGRTEGLVLDPVYTGKAMAGLIAQIGRGRWRKDETVVFFHSGGGPSLFAHAAALAEHAAT
jgi:1-aminocyclopropane-1-carboxylate deaminase/D-cysteine desulfhydrase-like pyridoxal-dependent ACC family enzyme